MHHVYSSSNILATYTENACVKATIGAISICSLSEFLISLINNLFIKSEIYISSKSFKSEIQYDK